MDRGWMLCTDENKAKIEKLQEKGSRKEVKTNKKNMYVFMLNGKFVYPGKTLVEVFFFFYRLVFRGQ